MGLEDDFPVAEHHVPRLRVPASRMDAWKEVAQDEIMRALADRHSWYNAFKDRVREGFDLIADRPQLKAFVRPVPNTNDKDILIRSMLEGVQLDDLVAGMYCDNTYDVRCAFAHLYEGNFLDAAVLQAYETRTHEDPMHFVGIRWICFRSPAPAIVTSRDFLFFSYEGTAYDVDGERVLFRFLRSMPMDDITIDKSNLPPLVTGKISNLHFYRQNGSRVDAFTKAMHSNAGNMPAWVVTKTISFMFPGIANVETICDARALLANGTAKLNPGRLKPLLAPAALSPSASPSSSLSRASHISPLGRNHHVNVAQVLASANACGVCFHKFKLTRAKRRCQGCIREVCKRCTKRMFFFDELKHISDTGVVALRFCLNCTRQARADVREANAHRVSFSTRRSSSGSTNSVSSLHRHSLPPPHPQQPMVRRGSSRHRYGYQPEGEPPVGESTTSSSDVYDHEDSDEESVEFIEYDPHQQQYHRPQRASTLDAHQIQQLHELQQQRQYDPHDHAEFLRLCGEYAARHERHQQPGKLVSTDQLARHQRSQQFGAASPSSFHYQRGGRSGGSRGSSASGDDRRGSSEASYASTRIQSPMHTRLDLMPRHMIPPMPQPDGPPRSHMTPSSTTTPRTYSAPNLHSHTGSPNDVHPRAASLPRPPQEGASPASEDLETIFRLRMMLFDGNGEAETETKSTKSTTSSTTSSSHHLSAGQHRKPLVPQLVPRY